MQSTKTLAIALTATIGAMLAGVLGIAIGKNLARAESLPAPMESAAMEPVAPAALPAPAASIEPISTPEGLIIRMSGEIDAASLDAATDALIAFDAAEPGTPVLIDAYDVTFMDSSGVALVEHFRLAGEAVGSPVVLLDPPHVVTEVLHLAGMHPSVPVVHTERVS